MILQELVRYYERKRSMPDSDLAPPGWIRRPVDYSLVLDAEGRCAGIEQRFDAVRNRKIGHSMLLPAIGKQALKHTNSGQDANLLWDNASFVLGRGARGAMKLESFISTIEQWFAAIPEDEGIRSILRFTRAVLANPAATDSLLTSEHVAEDFAERDPILVFRLAADAGEFLHERSTVRAAYLSRQLTATAGLSRGRCLASGDVDVPLAPNETVIKGVWKAQTSGANIVSLNAPAFVSYGKEDRQAEGSPISVASSFAYSTTLNHLLASDRQRVQVGDASTVFWADRDSAFESLFADLFGSHDDPDRGSAAVKALFDALKSGQLPVGERDVKFFVLGLAPNAARIAVRFWLHAPLAELAPRVLQHFADLRVVRRYDSDPLTPSIYPLLKSVCLRQEIKHVPPRLAGEWMRSILEGLPYPASLLNAAVVRCKAEQSAKDQQGRPKDNVPYLRAAILKGWLNRDHRRRNPALPFDHSEFKETLDMDQPDVPYRLGRLFAVLERIQQQAQPGINATIRDRYYGAASTTPVAVFTTLLRLKNAHLKKLPEGQTIYFERMVGDICGTVVDPKVNDFPRQLTLPEQGRFALGYYHQRQSFYAKKDATETTVAQEA
jgi:CRISPR-associated protein Csd1